MKAAFKPGFNYLRAGVMLLDLQAGSVQRGELAHDDEATDRGSLMATVDRLNDRFGRGAVALASRGQSDGRRGWRMKQSLKTPDTAGGGRMCRGCWRSCSSTGPAE
ncbi:MAG: DUF4113 domain-containing protein [Gammaproteobacteria bacterium]|nr:DUF4113 domain-containing protein [Gammaproteobacteria bacterium]